LENSTSCQCVRIIDCDNHNYGCSDYDSGADHNDNYRTCPVGFYASNCGNAIGLYVNNRCVVWVS
jgi:hypothetical protein